jgi:membrane protein YqaA with SNARE-associated domain
MEQFVQLLIEWGPLGMFIAAFLAGSVVPFSSELVMLGLLATGV